MAPQGAALQISALGLLWDTMATVRQRPHLNTNAGTLLTRNLSVKPADRDTLMALLHDNLDICWPDDIEQWNTTLGNQGRHGMPCSLAEIRS
jgi:hypothetical protein